MNVATSAATREPTGRVAVRFSGDSGDGVQLLGGLFAGSSARNRHDIITFPDFPAEIRAPVGTTYGVSSYQIQFGGPFVVTPGDEVDVLVAFNPAALKTNLQALRKGGLLIADAVSFSKKGNLQKAGYTDNPLEDDQLDGYRVEAIDISRLCAEATADTGVTKKQADQARNFWALGLVYWLFDRKLEQTQHWIDGKFGGNAPIAAANSAALHAGYHYGETMELDAASASHAAAAEMPAGTYRSITGIDAMALGLAAAAACSGLKVVYCSYPITPASSLLHGLAKLKGRGAVTFQAEDEIAAATAAIGASWGGSLGVTGSSGPGLALKGEALGLAVAAELPLIVVNVQRAGPSTGMPTKAEQADLLMALHGRHGESPCAVIAPATPAECFDTMLEAARIATTYMTPVIVLADGYLANAAQPWRLPEVESLPDLRVDQQPDAASYQPFARDDKTLARQWAVPGTPELMHRIGGIERGDGDGHISYDPDNHQQMTNYRAEKIAGIADSLPATRVERGVESGDLAIIGWGSTYGAIHGAVNELCKSGHSVAHIHLRNLNPLPADLPEMLKRFKQILVVEMNSGQLHRLLRAEFLLDAKSLTQVSGKPFKVARVRMAALALLQTEQR